MENEERINSYIDEFSLMGRGEKIHNPNGSILFFGNIYVSRRSLKHIVEQRCINDGLDAHEIKLLAKRAQMMLMSPEVAAKSKGKKYPRSYIYGRFDFGINQGVIAIVNYAYGGRASLITIFYKGERRFLRLLQRNSP